MPMVVTNESMFPPSSFSYKENAEGCKKQFGVAPRPHWITTEFGGTVSFSDLWCSNCNFSRIFLNFALIYNKNCLNR